MIAILDLYGFKKAVFVHKFDEVIDYLIITPPTFKEFEKGYDSTLEVFGHKKTVTFKFEKQIDEDTFVYKVKEN